jgi:hypothetical protein
MGGPREGSEVRDQRSEVKDISNDREIRIVVLGGWFWIGGYFGWGCCREVWVSARKRAQDVKNLPRRHRERA